MKVYIVVHNVVQDGFVENEGVKVFSAYYKAKKYFDEKVEKILKDYPEAIKTTQDKYDCYMYDLKEDYFSLFYDGYYTSDHNDMHIEMCEVQ